RRLEHALAARAANGFGECREGESVAPVARRTGDDRATCIDASRGHRYRASSHRAPLSTESTMSGLLPRRDTVKGMPGGNDTNDPVETSPGRSPMVTVPWPSST